jgi:hypothetical protein
METLQNLLLTLLATAPVRVIHDHAHAPAECGRCVANMLQPLLRRENGTVADINFHEQGEVKP